MRNQISIVFAALAATVLALATSCSKEENAPTPSDWMSISITGAMGDYVPAGEMSKAAVESVVRVKWEKDDRVYVLDDQQCLGYLTASVDPDDPRYATLSGKVKNTSSSKLLLIYCPTLTLEQGKAMTSVEFDFSEQSEKEIPFVIYKVIDKDFIPTGEGDLMETPDRIIQFKFASSIMKVNLTGLADNNNISEAVISQVNNGLSIKLGNDGAVITSKKIGGSTITRRSDKGFSNVTTDGRAAFTVAMVENTGNASRTLVVKTSNGIISSSNFTASALEAGASYNSVYALKGYVPIGGKKWATKNLGATTIASSAATAYGDYYEWGTTRKLYKSVSFSAYDDGSFSFADSFKDNGYSWQSYLGVGTWDPNKDFKPYDETSKVLTPENDIAHKALGGGWRMPTYEDFADLFEACGGTGKKMILSAVSDAKNADGSLHKGIYWCEYGQETFDDIKVPGVLFVDDSGNALFFPAAGEGYQRIVAYEGNRGSYWSSNLVSDNGTGEYGTGSALFLDINENDSKKCVFIDHTSTRFYGLSIRPVSD